MILSVDELCFSYPDNRILEDINFIAKRGQLLAILGPNGIGKTTILKCINKLLSIDKGSVFIEDKDLNNLSRLDLAKITGYVEQNREGYRSSVFNSVLLGRKPYIDKDISDEDIRVTSKILDSLGLSDMAFRNLDELSGGELQKVIIARALAQEPKLLLMDEPTNHLDMKNQVDVLNIISHITKKDNISAIITMHDLNLALRYADKFMLIKDKKIFDLGGEEIITEENIKSVYGLDVDIVLHKSKKVVIPF